MSEPSSARRRVGSGALLATGLLAVGSLLAGCSGDADVSVRTDREASDAEIDLRTDASTTTAPPGAGAPRTTSVAPGTPGLDDDDLTGPPRPGPAVDAVVPVDPGAPLGTALLSSGPTGWARESETAQDLGPLTIVEAAAALGDPEAELALLTTRRLRAAYARRWTSTEGGSATVVAYQFADAEGALAYEVDSMLSLVAAGAVESTGAATSRAFYWEQGDQRVDGRSVRRMERLYLVIVRQGTPELADALILAQAQQLAG